MIHARSNKIAQRKADPTRGRSTLTDPTRGNRVCGAVPFLGWLRLLVDLGRVAQIDWVVGRTCPGCDHGRMDFDHVAQQVPDIGAAIAWWRETVPGSTVLYEDATWGLIDAGGVKLAFVTADQHPDHLAWKVSDAELEAMAAARGLEIHPHRDGTRSFYVEAPGGRFVEIISYPEGA